MKHSLLFALLISAPLHGGSITIQAEPFEATLTLDATFLPSAVQSIEITPKEWATFTIKELVDHGTVVKKGDLLIQFDDEAYLKALTEAQENAKSRALKLTLAERELADLKTSTPRALEGLKIAHDRAKERLDYFNTTGRQLDEEDAADGLKNAELRLSYQEEELKQLLKMYEEDDVIEETEEIILTRQRATVDAAKFALKKTIESTKWALEKSIPQKGVDLQRTFDDALLAYESGKVTLPKKLAEKELDFAKTKRQDEEASKKLKDLEADRAFFTLTAPADGLIYFGEFTDTTWTTGKTDKFLFLNGSAPAKTTLLTLIPTDSPLFLAAAVSQTDRLAIPADAKGFALVDGLDQSNLPVELTKLNLAPTPQGQYDLRLTAKLPEDSPVVPTMKAKITLTTYLNKDAVVIPEEAVTTKNGKSTVELKMDDGKSQVHEVKLGRRSNGKIEILEGLAVDQVIHLPDSQ